MAGNRIGRTAVQSDLPELLRLYGFLKNEPAEQADEDTKAVWNTILNDEKQQVIVIEQDGRLVSSCTLIIIPNLTHSRRPYALVENVVTDPDYRKKGYASACLDMVLQIAKKANCYKIMLMTGSKSKATMRFYEGAGYSREDKTAFVRWLDV